MRILVDPSRKPISAEEIVPLLAAASRLPRPARWTPTRRCACGTDFKAEDGLKVKRSPLGGELIDLGCPNCQKSDYAMMACLTCCEIFGRLEPHREPKTGFEFKKNTIYHVEHCAVCAPETRNAPIVEFAQHVRAAHNNPIQVQKT